MTDLLNVPLKEIPQEKTLAEILTEYAPNFNDDSIEGLQGYEVKFFNPQTGNWEIRNILDILRLAEESQQ